MIAKLTQMPFKIGMNSQKSARFDPLSWEKIGQIDEFGEFANQVDRAIYDVVMLTFAHVQKASLIEKKSEIIDALKTLCTTDEGFKDAIGRATRDKARINTRVRLWRERLAGLGLQCPVLAYGE